MDSSRFGKVVCCEVIRDKKSQESLQYAFVEFEDQVGVANHFNENMYNNKIIYFKKKLNLVHGITLSILTKAIHVNAIL